MSRKLVRDSIWPRVVVRRQSDPSGVFQDDMLHLLGDRCRCRETSTRWYTKLSMVVGVSTSSHRFVYRLFGLVSRSLCACRLGCSREFATCEYTCSLFFQTRATQTGVDACHYWFVIGSGVGGARLKAAPRPLRSDHGAVNNALNSCGQRVDRALLSRYSCALALGCSGILVFWCPGALVFEGCHAIRREAEASV